MSYLPPVAQGSTYAYGPPSYTGANGTVVSNVRYAINNDAAAKALTFNNFACYVSATVDLATLNNTVTLFTTASDRGRFFPTEVWYNPQTAGGITSPVIRLGFTNSGTTYSDWISAGTITASLVVNEFLTIALKANAAGASPTGRYSAPPSTPIVLVVGTAGSAGTSGRFCVFGVYVS